MAAAKLQLRRTLTYAGMAKDMAVLKRTSNETVRDNARRHLAARMGKLRGLPQKIGQMLSMSTDPEQADVFSNLTDNATPLPLETLRPIMEKEWQTSLANVLTEIEPEGRAASLGQVHRGTLESGRDVAVKVAYPGIRAAVMNDLKVLGWLSGPVGDLRRGFDLADYRKEMVRDLEEELDYRIELRHQQRFGELARQVVGLVVPDVIAEWSTQRVLVTAWEDGVTIDEAANWPAASREELARRLLTQFLTCLFDFGIVHGDPHPGNYRFRDDPSSGPTVVLYDYGSVKAVCERDRLLLLRLIIDTGQKRGDPFVPLVELGFNEWFLEPIRAKLPAVCSVLFEPFGQVGKFDLTSWQRGERLDDVLGDDRWNFRMAGPAKLILLMRAFGGVQYYLRRLGEPISWGIIMRPILERHAAALARLELPASTGTKGRFESMARHLRIEIHRDGVKKASLTLPAAAIDDLDSVIDDDLGARIKARRIDLPDIVRRVRSTGYAPAELFTLEEDDEGRRIRVWVE